MSSPPKPAVRNASAALALACLLAPAAAFGQTRAQQDFPELARGKELTQGHSAASLGNAPTLGSKEKKTIDKLRAAVAAKDFATAAQALAAAQGLAKSPQAKFMVASLQLDLGKATDNVEMQAAALEAALVSGHVLKSARPDIYDMQGQVALKRGDKVAAEAAFAKVAEARPTNPQALVKLAEAKYQLGKLAESLSLVTRAISLQRAARQEVPASWTEAAEKLSAGVAASAR